MEIKLNDEKLISAIKEMKRGGYTYAEMTRESGVYNIGRIAAGKIAPTLQSWLRLHESFPQEIPPLSLTDGTHLYERQENTIRQTDIYLLAGMLRSLVTFIERLLERVEGRNGNLRA